MPIDPRCGVAIIRSNDAQSIGRSLSVLQPAALAPGEQLEIESGMLRLNQTKSFQGVTGTAQIKDGSGKLGDAGADHRILAEVFQNNEPLALAEPFQEAHDLSPPLTELGCHP